MMTHFIAFSTAILYNEMHEFGVLSFILTFLLGLQEGALYTQVGLIYGFEFDSNLEPFAIYRMVNCASTAFTNIALAKIETLEGYRIFFIVSLIITVVSQSVMSYAFKYRRVSLEKEGKSESELKQLIIGNDKNNM